MSAAMIQMPGQCFTIHFRVPEFRKVDNIWQQWLVSLFHSKTINHIFINLFNKVLNECLVTCVVRKSVLLLSLRGVWTCVDLCHRKTEFELNIYSLHECRGGWYRSFVDLTRTGSIEKRKLNDSNDRRWTNMDCVVFANWCTSRCYSCWYFGR